MDTRVQELLTDILFTQCNVSDRKGSKIATTLQDKAVEYHGRKEYPEAEFLYKMSLAIWQNTHQPDQKHIASCLCQLAKVYADQSLYDDSAPVFLKAIRIWEGINSPDENLGQTLCSYADVLWKLHRDAEADLIAQRARTILSSSSPNPQEIKANERSH